MSNRFANIFAAIILIVMFFLAVFSIKDDTFTFDETAHIAAGYSYLTKNDYRLNPEHPPIIKDLAAFPLLFFKINFPRNHPSWLQETPPPWWTQFDFATQFLYKSGNSPDQILFWSRMPMIFILVFLGWFLFFFAKKYFGNKIALISLFFFSFSPTILAHGRLITTDVGAALGVVLSTFFWLKFLKNPDKKNIILTGLVFGGVMLLKFNLILLIPFFSFITLIYAWLGPEERFLFRLLKYLSKAFLIGIVGLVFVVWPIYFFHTFNYPPQQQLRDTQFLLSHSSIPKFLRDVNIWLVKNPIFRPFGHYILGLFLAINRSTTGHTTFFLGEISAKGWRTYFPIVYLIKEPLAFHLFTLIGLFYIARLIKKLVWEKSLQRMKNLISSYIPEFAMLTFLTIYWLTSLISKLNIGVRHLLPVFPFTFILVAYTISLWLRPPYFKIKFLFFIILIIWQIISVVSIYPHFLAYFNELVGGAANGYLYVVDSNLDWGQDLKRFKKWLDQNKIDKVYFDYFGGGNAEYYLKEKFSPWWGERKPRDLIKGSYLAVSVSQLQGGRGLPAKNYDGPNGYYLWLNQYEPPVTKIGYSIFVYRVE